MSEQIDTPETVVESIRSGQYDDHISAINRACFERSKHIAYVKGHQLVPGDRVKFVRGRPRYLLGELATITKIMQSYVLLKLDRDCGKFYAGVDIRTPMSLIEKVAKDTPPTQVPQSFAPQFVDEGVDIDE